MKSAYIKLERDLEIMLRKTKIMASININSPEGIIYDNCLKLYNELKHGKKLNGCKDLCRIYVEAGGNNSDILEEINKLESILKSLDNKKVYLCSDYMMTSNR
jgi:hypothetical protein